ncbi:hypothetical protein GM921_10530 [Pedobacter sp. LMG 31464]|uniref:Uncharacterized protein n=1 Tax=Pedobacter planticolens TaxID=2679964 RepID=A0A923DXL2_9SPHI|nr:hypothetical protein [Pedobacter planticolens]MBB2145924.1 hypothetical protein [Pedobacter planticolens]
MDSYKNGFPLAKIYFYSIFFIPVVFYRYLICRNEYQKKSFSYAFDGFCIAYASKIILKNYLREISPKKIIIANQLSCYHRSLANTAKNLGIETIYIQHASVTENFSDLNVFSSALLEGEDSLMKYQLNGTANSNLYLIGMPKFDQFFDKIKQSELVKTIGVCTNGTDDFDAYVELINNLHQSFPEIELIIRPHPSDRRKSAWFDLAMKNNAKFSDVKEVESFKFFESTSLIIAGDSNIHLEAGLLNIPSIYFDSSKKNIDWYGFVKNKLAHYADDAAHVLAQINHFSINLLETRSRAKFYVETVNTKFDGKSSVLASLIIQGNHYSYNFKIETDQFGNTIFRVI